MRVGVVITILGTGIAQILNFLFALLTRHKKKQKMGFSPLFSFVFVF